MLDMNDLQLSDLDKLLNPVYDEHLSDLKKAWYHDPQQSIDHDAFVDKDTESPIYSMEVAQLTQNKVIAYE